MNVYYILAVGAGGFLGAITRYYTSQKLNKTKEDRLPLGTLAVNLIGSFLLGFILSVGLKDIYTLLIGTGFLGAFTTFSTLHKELLILQKYPRKWLIYFVITYSGGLVFAFLGYLLGK
ncbi:fluoride efflux transporter CrcB [Psychrobacillus sp. NEAU-3TGS]|uniref:fluoride efflux transporter CrcB n=1 Tax=Psychrobacillus sp. NEAU-3TGS TaxID=2995412 RepID=UPI00249996E4|nr:fluoride efflux transporter CrcB [Psychrobacillus sp. NEAU-3TGS]MDI2586143.1 fluoride efflux transporter CrcB [Psychrobacillus sp. NEAU-3TGS]